MRRKRNPHRFSRCGKRSNGAPQANEKNPIMFRDMSQQLNFAATVSVLTMVLLVLSSGAGALAGG
jgi:hypothetical protein